MPYEFRSYQTPLLFLSLLLSLCLLPAPHACAQRGLSVIPDPDPAKQQASFEVAEGFTVNLFAAEPMIAKPIQMNFDSAGRLWVATSETYPHIKPGQPASDKIIVLEDIDHDGVADKQTVFVDGLLMPTAILPADGGVYVGASTELLFFRDTDGDGKADEKKIVLSGFGTEDTHHMIHTLKRGPSGHIYFNQSIYTHSHLETPFGVKRLLAGGTWKMDPHTIELDVYSRGLVNPWGLAFNEYGQSFETDGAGSQGIHYVFPDVVMFTAYNAERTIPGLNPGQPKHCGLELLTGDHLPGSWSGRFITNDFRGNRINSFELSPSGSGYVSVQQENLLSSNYVSFRPVDVIMGPDGAIYVADWYNPIIQHGEVDFRDERRDHEHGRIWRIAPTAKKTLPQPLPSERDPADLITLLSHPQQWWREAARYELAQRGNPEIARQISEMARKLNEDQGQLLLEALWTLQAMRQIDEPLLLKATTAPDERVRAAALRIAGDVWESSRLHVLARQAIADEHPQVRLEAVHLLRDLATPAALLTCTAAIRPDNDQFLQFALWQTFRDTESIWVSEFMTNPDWETLPVTALLSLAESARSPAVLNPLLQWWETGKLPATSTPGLLRLVSEKGQPQQLQTLWELAQKQGHPQRNNLLTTLIQTASRRGIKPTSDQTEIVKLLSSSSAEIQGLGAELAGLWQISAAGPQLQQLVAEHKVQTVREKSLLALSRLNEPAYQQLLLDVAGGRQHQELQITALDALANTKIHAAAEAAVALLATTDAAQTQQILQIFFSRKQGPNALANALKDRKLPAETAILGVRGASNLSQKNPALVQAFQTAGGLEPIGKNMTPEQMAELAGQVIAKGNIPRGEEIYRREKLQCLKCHAIGGAGGKVGPDLTSIGASAPVDYLIESLFEPNKKIKEGYHTLQVVTVDGLIKAGVAILQNQDEIHLRDAEGKIQIIPTEDIELSQMSPVSLMPADLVSQLPRHELIDLVRFLAALGKSDGLAVPQQRFVRTWDIQYVGDRIKEITDAIRHNGPQHAVTDDPVIAWNTGYSHVDGSLRTAPLELMGNVDGHNLQFVRFGVEVISAGKIGLKIEQPQGLRIWADTNEVEVASLMEIDLPAGTHRITVAIEPAARNDQQLRIELLNLPGSSGQAQLKN